MPLDLLKASSIFCLYTQNQYSIPNSVTGSDYHVAKRKTVFFSYDLPKSPHQFPVIPGLRSLRVEKSIETSRQIHRFIQHGHMCFSPTSTLQSRCLPQLVPFVPYPAEPFHGPVQMHMWWYGEPWDNGSGACRSAVLMMWVHKLTFYPSTFLNLYLLPHLWKDLWFKYWFPVT